MANRRERVHAFYNNPEQYRNASFEILEKAAAAADRFPFTGAKLVYAIVVRTDLNGYSAWAREREVGDRAALLDSFFSTAIPMLDQKGGVFFRDEGDCLISLFTSYFSASVTFAAAERYAMNLAGLEFGDEKLTAKSCISCGHVAIYQKAHERGSSDWSAEGEPFVRAARLEQAAESKPQVMFYADEYDSHFLSTNSSPGPSFWKVERVNLQVPGLGLAGGWTEVVRLVRS